MLVAMLTERSSAVCSAIRGWTAARFRSAVVKRLLAYKTNYLGRLREHMIRPTNIAGVQNLIMIRLILNRLFVHPILTTPVMPSIREF